MHPVPVLGIPLLNFPPAGTGHSVTMVMMMTVTMKLGNLSRERIILAILHQVGVAISCEELLIDNRVYSVVVAGDRLNGEVVRAEAVLRLLEGIELRV